MKLKNKFCFLLIFATIILNLFSCNVNSNLFSNYEDSLYVTETENVSASLKKSVGGSYGMSRMYAANEMSLDSASNNSYADSIDDRKIIRTVNISAETTDFDNSIELLKKQVASFSGIIDSSYIDNGNKTSINYKKNASFNLRIPTNSADKFFSLVGNSLNVTFEQEDLQDVTDNYDDTMQRKQTLTTEQTKLNELLAKAKNVDEIIKIEEKISSNSEELANIDRKLKRLDKQIDYTTFNISITEVVVLSEIKLQNNEVTKDTLISGIKTNFEKTKQFVINIGVYLFTHLPAIALVVITAIIALLILRGIIRFLFNKKNSTREKISKKENIKRQMKDDTSDKYINANDSVDCDNVDVEILDDDDKNTDKSVNKAKNENDDKKETNSKNKTDIEDDL